MFAPGLAPQYVFFKTKAGAERYQKRILDAYSKSSVLTDLLGEVGKPAT